MCLHLYMNLSPPLQLYPKSTVAIIDWFHWWFVMLIVHLAFYTHTCSFLVHNIILLPSIAIIQQIYPLQIHPIISSYRLPTSPLPSGSVPWRLLCMFIVLHGSREPKLPSLSLLWGAGRIGVSYWSNVGWLVGSVDPAFLHKSHIHIYPSNQSVHGCCVLFAVDNLIYPLIRYHHIHKINIE